MSYTLSADINLGAANTGLTLTAALFDSGGSAAAGLATSYLAEVAAGSGSYLWTGTLPEGHRGYIAFSSGATFKTKVVINPQETEAIVSGSIAAVDPPPLLNGSRVTAIRGDTMVLAFTGLGDITGWSKLWFTVKAAPGDTDAEAILQVEEGSGLLVLNGAATTSSYGSTTVVDASSGAVTFTVDEAAMAELELKSGHIYDVQVLIAGRVTTLTQGIFSVRGDATRAIL